MVDLSMSAGKKVSILEFLLTIGFAILALIYLMLTATSHDLLWFWPKFNNVPVQMTIRCYGQERKLEGTSEEAQAITMLVNEQLSGNKRFDTLNLSTPTYDYYQNDPGVMTLKLDYSSPVRIHLPNVYFTNITSLLIPLEGRYANTSIIFGMIYGVPTGGSLHVNSTQPIIDYLTITGLCTNP
jgi:hypothetical protein